MKNFRKSLSRIFENDIQELEKKVLEQAKKKGYNVGPVYHGSNNPDITVFDTGETAYGIFFAPDLNTADYYKSNDSGRVYKVFLKATKELDLTEDMTRYEFFKHTFGGSGDTDFFIDDEKIDEDFISEVINNSIKNGKLERIKQVLPKIDEDDEGIVPAEEFTPEFVKGYLDYENPDMEVLVKLIKELNPKLRIIEKDSDVEEISNAYGSQDFYMNYQDDVMRYAENQGYDLVIFDDPSSTGQALSYVVFDPSQVKLADPITEDDNGNVIPIENRFNSSKNDIRY